MAKTYTCSSGIKDNITPRHVRGEFGFALVIEKAASCTRPVIGFNIHLSPEDALRFAKSVRKQARKAIAERDAAAASQFPA